MCCKVIEIVLNNLLLQSAMLLQCSVLETLNEAIVGCLASLLIWLLLLPGASPHTVCCHVTLGHLTNTNTKTKTKINTNTNKTRDTNAKFGYYCRTYKWKCKKITSMTTNLTSINSLFLINLPTILLPGKTFIPLSLRYRGD